MEAFAQLGFMAVEMADWMARRAPRGSAYLALASDISRFFFEHLYKIPVRRRDCHGRNVDRDSVVVLLGVRGFSLFQSTVLLSARGMAADAAITCRALIEIIFRLAAIQRTQEALAYYIAEDEHHRRGTIKKLLKLNAVSDEELVRLRQTLGEVEAAIARSGHRTPLKVSEWAALADMESTYRTIYGYLSSHTHTGVRTLEPMVIITEGSDPDELAFEPQFDESLLLAALEYILILCETLAYEFGLHWEPQIAPLRARFHDLHEQAARNA
jgi:hypothetical protein